jgi:DNA mismatch repair protein MutS
VRNVHLDATEHGDGVVFLHTVKPGPANRSYGLAVAKLAGVPREVIEAARRRLETLEAQRDAIAAAGPQAELPLFASSSASASAAPADADADALGERLRRELEALDPDELTPRAALEALYRLRELTRR